MAYFHVTLRTGERDLHSGMYGGAALNAVHVLMACFDAVLAGPNGLLPEPLRAGITAPTAEELQSWSELPPGGEELSSQGARPLDPNAADQFYIRTFAEPSADVTGFLGGKPGLRNTTLSVKAAGQVTIRLAPGQDLRTIGETAEKLMRDAAPDGAEIEIAWEGAPPGLMRPDSPAIQLGLEAFEQVLGVRPLLVRAGGTLPIVPALADRGIPTVLTGFGLPESNVHSPNERFLVRYFDAGVDTAAALFTKYGELPV
jgi:acetylornithine deacetylase/succinyl-diaminopimelate desuccinylase-like protein